MRIRSYVSILLVLCLVAAVGYGPVRAQTPGSSACVCGDVTEFTAPAAGTPGSITIGGQSFVIAETTTITNSELIAVGANLCLSAAQDPAGALVGPAAVVESGGGLSVPPALNVPASITTAQGNALGFDVFGTDLHGGVVTLDACGLPENATFDATTGQFSFTPSTSQANQSFVVTFTATSCFGGTVTRTVTINVGASGSATPGGPFFTTASNSFRATPGAEGTFNITATSPVAGCAVTVTASGLPAGAAFDAATGDLTFTPTEDQLGQSFTALFTATDCNDVTSTFALPINVTAGDGSTPGAICVPVKKVQFANTPVGSTCGAVTITVFNSGGQSLTVNSAALTNGTDFHIVGTSQNGSALAAGGQLQFTIVFAPTSRGKKNDTLTITSDATNAPTLTVRLTGKGT